MDNSKTVAYGKPEIADYGDLRELTEGCLGGSGDLEQTAISQIEFITSKIHCVTGGN